MRKFLMAHCGCGSCDHAGVASADPDAAAERLPVPRSAPERAFDRWPDWRCRGAGVGGTVGAGASSSPRHREEVVIEREAGSASASATACETRSATSSARKFAADRSAALRKKPRSAGFFYEAVGVAIMISDHAACWS